MSWRRARPRPSCCWLRPWRKGAFLPLRPLQTKQHCWNALECSRPAFPALLRHGSALFQVTQDPLLASCQQAALSGSKSIAVLGGMGQECSCNYVPIQVCQRAAPGRPCSHCSIIACLTRRWAICCGGALSRSALLRGITGSWCAQPS
jgi:hypothetical protein